MDHRREEKKPGVPSRASDRALAAVWRAWIDAAMAWYERQGGYQRIIVQKVVRRPEPQPGR